MSACDWKDNSQPHTANGGINRTDSRLMLDTGTGEGVAACPVISSFVLCFRALMPNILSVYMFGSSLSETDAQSPRSKGLGLHTMYLPCCMGSPHQCAYVPRQHHVILVSLVLATPWVMAKVGPCTHLTVSLTDVSEYAFVCLASHDRAHISPASAV